MVGSAQGGGGGCHAQDFYIQHIMGTPGLVPRDDGWPLLFIGTCVTVTHSMLPLRSCIVWPMELFSLILYPLLLLSTDVSEFPLANWFTLCTLVFSSAFGKRNLEIQERSSFHKVCDLCEQREAGASPQEGGH